MAYIDLTRPKYTAASECTVCVNNEECKIIEPVIKKALLKESIKLERYRSIHELGEATSRQQTQMVLCEGRVDALFSIWESITDLLKAKQS